MTRNFFSTLTAIIATLSTVIAYTGALAAQDLFTDDPVKEIDAYFSDRIPLNGPGAVVLAMKDAEVILRRGYGMANIELGVPMRPEMVFCIGSITKQFTSACIMMLVDEGKLSLDNEITKFIPDYPTGGNKITIHNLLNHTSGIRSYDEIPGYYSGVREDLGPDEVVDLFKDEPMDFRPGEQFKYNNSGYFLLGIIIEKVSGSTYGEFVIERIFKPLGMKNSYHASRSLIIPNRATGYQSADDGFVNADYLSMTQFTANGSLLSTVDDLWIWTNALHSGKVVSQESLGLMTTPTDYAIDKTEHYGYGLWLKPLFGEKAIAHNGGLPGYLTYALYLPEKNIFVAVLTNALVVVDAPFMGKWTAALLCGKEVRRKKAITLDDETLDGIVGVYEISEEVYRTITREGNSIYSQDTDNQKREIFASSETEFFCEESFSYFTVERDKTGKVIKMVIHGQGPDVEAVMTERQPRESRIIQFDVEDSGVFVGHYESEDGVRMIIKQKDGRFYAQVDDQPEFEIFPESPTGFFFKVIEAQLEFIVNTEQEVTGLTLSQGGRSLEMKRK